MGNKKKQILVIIVWLILMDFDKTIVSSNTLMLTFATVKPTIIASMSDSYKFSAFDKIRVHFNGLPFKSNEKQIIFYDPLKESEFSDYIGTNLTEISAFFQEIGFEFCYFPEIFRQLTPEQVRYHFPNWNGEPLHKVGNDLLKPYLAPEDRDIGACFLRLFDKYDGTFSCYQLRPSFVMKWEDQLAYYKRGLMRGIKAHQNDEGSIMYSVVCNDSGDYQRKIIFDIEKDFEEQANKVLDELKDFLKSVSVQGIREFVLNCSVPVESRLSRLVIDENYNIILPDFGNIIIDIGPMPKAVYLLFLRHEEGINFKSLVDYKKELEGYYETLTNRTTRKIIEDSIDAVVDPTRNTLNEKISRIRRAFLEQIDESLAKNYCITGLRGEAKRITLPRELVEWR